MSVNVIELNAKIFNNEMVVTNPIKNLLHDIRSPLQALQALVSKHNLSKEREDEIFQRCLAKIQSLVYTEKQVHPTQRSEAFCIVNLLRDLRHMKQLELGVTLNIQIKLNNPWLDLNITAQELFNILSNLVNNSINAEGSKRLSIRVQKNNSNQIIIDVIDNGNGLNQEKLKAIGRYGTSFTKGGQGIGLASAIAKLEKHGAQLMCRSIPNSITQFSIIFPR